MPRPRRLWTSRNLALLAALLVGIAFVWLVGALRGWWFLLLLPVVGLIFVVPLGMKRRSSDSVEIDDDDVLEMTPGPGDLPFEVPGEDAEPPGDGAPPQPRPDDTGEHPLPPQPTPETGASPPPRPDDTGEHPLPTTPTPETGAPPPPQPDDTGEHPLPTETAAPESGAPPPPWADDTGEYPLPRGDRPEAPAGAAPPAAPTKTPSGVWKREARELERDVLTPGELPAPLRTDRYANVWLFDTSAGAPVDQSRPLAPGVVLGLTITIDRLDPRSAVRDPEPFPEELVEPDAWLRVLVSSAEFVVAAREDELGRGSYAVERPFRLPGDGSPATSESGIPLLGFVLRAPASEGEARVHIGYYFRDALVQSQVIEATVGGEVGSVVVRTNYTASKLLDGLGTIPDVPRLSLMVDDGPGESRSIVLRTPGGTTSSHQGRGAVTWHLPDSVVRPIVVRLRRELTDRISHQYRGRRAGADDVDVDVHRRRRDDLIRDLRTLAPLGLELHSQLLTGPGARAVAAMHVDPPRPVVSVGRPRGVRFLPPWNLVYDIDLPRGVEPEVCPLVKEWDGRSPLVTEPRFTCPREADTDHSHGLLCPFGFWGFSQTIEAPASSDDPACTIHVRPGAVVAVGETRHRVDLDALTAHVDQLRAIFRRRFPGVTLARRWSREGIREVVEPDLPLVYLYCHGHKERNDSPDTWLSVGAKEYITADDFVGWVRAAARSRPPRVIWDQVRPLVFINACHSLDVLPETVLSYVDAFVGWARSPGVIGTEVQVPPSLAMRWAEAFFTALVEEGGRADQALRSANFDLLALGNLFGLVYTGHCWAHLAFLPAAA